MSEITNTKIERNIKTSPIFYALINNFVIFTIINVSWLTKFKGLTYNEYFLIDVIACIVSLVLTIPILLFISKLGNNRALKLGCVCFFLSALLYYIGEGFFSFALAGILCYFYGNIALTVFPCIVENNLKILKKDNSNFLAVMSKGKLIYSTITLISCIFTGFLFDYNPHIPMLIFVGFAFVALLLSFYIKDFSNDNYDAKAVLKSKLDVKSLRYVVFFLLFIILFKGASSIAFSYTKISPQEVGFYMSLISIVLFIGRAFQVLINAFAKKIILKLKRKLFILLPINSFLGIMCLFLPLLVINDFYAQVVLIILGSILIYGPYDLYKLLLQYDVLENFKKEEHLKLFFLSGQADTIGVLLTSLTSSAALGFVSVGASLSIVSAFAILALFVGIFLFCYNRKGVKKDDELVKEEKI